MLPLASITDVYSVLATGVLGVHVLFILWVRGTCSDMLVRFSCFESFYSLFDHAGRCMTVLFSTQSWRCKRWRSEC